MVPGSQPTVQAGINAANNGDTVLVGPGTYVENINFNGKAITLTSAGGPLVTILDGGANGTVVTFNNNETTSATLSGFTIRNGLQNGLPGGGILISAASPTISNNIITGNHAAVGIGMYISGGSPVIRNNTITGNNQAGAGDGGAGGGGILVEGSTSTLGAPQIVNNIITNNSVAGGGVGGGISVFYYSSPLIQGNLIRGNSAYNGGGGISLQSYDSPVVLQNVIVNNTTLSGGSGGGMYVSPINSPVTILNNTIAGNNATDGTSGIFTTGFAQYATFTNNIVVAFQGQNAITCNTNYSSISPVFSYNDSYSAGGGAWSGPCDTSSNPGNISADPLFLSAPNNDFHLALGSPAIDAGNNTAAGLPSTDYDNNPRIADGNGDGVSVVDLGAYEVVSSSSANLDTSTLSFDFQSIGTTSAAQAVTLTSTGTTSFQITSIRITGDFTESSTCPVLGAPGDSTGVANGSPCTFSVTFTPTVGGSRTGSLTINGTNGVSLSVGLNGTGTPIPTVILSTSVTNLVFPVQAVGTQSSAQSVVLSNTGVGTASISSITLNGPFVQTNNCGSALQAGSSCTINVVFSPSASGSASSVLVIQDSADGLTSSVNLSGTGIDYSVSAATPSAGVVAGHSVDISVSVFPLGGSFGNAVSLSCAGLPSMSTCSFSPPSVVPGANLATSVMTISTQAATPGGVFFVTVTGTSGSTLAHSGSLQLSVNKPALSLSAMSVVFPLVAVGSRGTAQTITLTNTNVGTFNISSIAVGGPFVQTNNCGSAVQINSSCTISLVFAPTMNGDARNVLSIQDSIDGVSYSVNLEGFGIDFSISLSTAATGLTAGNSINIPVSINPLAGIFQSSVSLSCAGLPNMSTCSFSPPSVTTSTSVATSIMTISTQAGTPGGVFSVTVTGTLGSTLTHSAILQLTILKPGVILSAMSLAFGNQPIGSQSAAQTVTLTNTNVGTVNFASISASGAFVQANNCGSALPINSSCTISVVFSPIATGPAANLLVIQDNVDGVTYSVNLLGAGVDFAIVPSVNSETIVRGNSGTITVNLAAVGGTFGNQVALSCSGLPSRSSCSLSPAIQIPGSSGASSIMTISTDQSATQSGTYSVIIKGTSGNLSHTAQLQITIAKAKQ
jgi:parallel beta-helix repeat protein